MNPSVAVVTLAHGRREHLARQQLGLKLGTRLPDHYIVVAMADEGLRDELSPVVGNERVIDIPAADGGHLPLAAARNLGAKAALDAGAEVICFLDVDCIPGRELVAAYADAAQQDGLQGCILAGPVTYLPEPDGDGYDVATIASNDSPHPARPAPNPGEIVRAGSPELFWSLSFAMRAETWMRVGGFCEEYSGYGAEDTDFAFTAAARGVDLVWVGAARAYHQWHPTNSPPTQHVADIVRNGNCFYRRWGWWPMSGWLSEFRELGLVTGGLGDTSLELVTPPSR